MNIRAANAARFDRDENFLVGDLGIWDVTKFEFVVGGQGQGFHGNKIET